MKNVFIALISVVSLTLGMGNTYASETLMSNALIHLKSISTVEESEIIGVIEDFYGTVDGKHVEIAPVGEKAYVRMRSGTLSPACMQMALTSIGAAKPLRMAIFVGSSEYVGRSLVSNQTMTCEISKH